MKATLAKVPDFEVDYINSWDQFINGLGDSNTDVFVFNLYMGQFTGIELAKVVKAAQPDTKVIIFINGELEGLFNNMVEVGIDGIVYESYTSKDFVHAIRLCYKGLSIIPTTLMQKLRKPEGIYPVGTNDGEVIDEKEKMILHQLAKGFSNKEIALLFQVSKRTIEYSLTKLYKKLNVKSRTEAVIKAKKLGLIKLDDLLG